MCESFAEHVSESRHFTTPSLGPFMRIPAPRPPALHSAPTILIKSAYHSTPALLDKLRRPLVDHNMSIW